MLHLAIHGMVSVRQRPKPWENLAVLARVVPLIQLLKEGEEDDREAAVSALGKIGDARVVEALGAALKDPGRKVHLAAIRALGKIYNSQALRLLVSELKRPAMDMHDAAQMALVENFGVEKVAGSPARLDVSPLVAILKNNDLSICHIAGIVLNRLGWSPETDEQKAWYWTALSEWGKCSTLGDPAVEPLIQVLQSAEPYRRVNAAQALGTIGSDRAVGALIAAQDKNTDIFTVLAEALATSGNERAVKPLVAALHDIDRYPAAAKALVKLYASGRLDMKKKQAILAQRELIIRGQHEDYYQTKHHDYEGRGLSSDPTDCHSDESYRTNHQDINVPGEEFSL